LQFPGKSFSQSLRPLCPTRWTCRCVSIQSVISNYQLLVAALTEISANNPDDSGAKASGFLRELESFKVLFGLHLSMEVLEPAESCSRLLQTANLSITEARSAALNTAKLLEGLRTDDKFDSLYNKCTAIADDIGVAPPVLPRMIKIPKRYDDGSAAATYTTPRDKYRQSYFEFIDRAVSCIKVRFQQPAMDTASKIESIVISACDTDQNAEITRQREEHLQIICNHYGSDINQDRLRRQLAMLPDLCQGKKVSRVPDLVECMKYWGKETALLFSEVTTLLRLLLVLPATSATAERSFSTLRRMKTYPRTTMTATRLNSVIVLHIHKGRTDAINVPFLLADFVSRNSTRKDFFGV
jgi:hypothetical protein